MSTNNLVVFTNTLRDCFDIYYYHTNSALTVSTREQGEFNISILLQVRSAMTHISRANCDSEISMDKRIEEIKNAQGHFIRAALDGYKIAYEERMKKIDIHIETLKEYYTQIPADFKKEHDDLKNKRTDLTLKEDGHPTSLETLNSYETLYIKTNDYYKKLIVQYNDKDLKRFKFKKIFMHRETWVYTIVGALISAVIGAIACWFLGILF